MTALMEPLKRADNIFRENAALAAAVGKLSIRWTPYKYRLGLYTTDCVSYFSFAAPEIFATLSGLKHLELHGMNRRTLKDYFRLHKTSRADGGTLSFQALGTYWPRLESLLISKAYFMSQELVAVVRCASPGLAELRLDHVETFDGTWPDTLRAIHSIAPSIKRLELGCLRDSTGERSHQVIGCIRFRGDDEAELNRSCDGGGTLSLRYREASMVGADAVKLGLDMFEVHAAAREEAWRRRFGKDDLIESRE
ncbi:hypothetical protein LTR56_015815 [Elasticomyces elasticus]|nr:hypothetical protein LTR56_015815 [Elasticomyces elasticus]KAK3644099.1 hypothetical protein LTR22_015421 [Elasticomyces elasticus]KAK4922022.1 hypothetical protein LTR49_010607 [Elasticomyces elasticus]KAK5768797.1 hypothetical protein LTS12_000857 [Elasticomyces elasticus]